MVYEVFEDNMPRLEKKLATIQNKCVAYGCDFHYEVVGETFRKVKDKVTGEVKTLRFVQVEASGKAQMDDWVFVATIEHNKPCNVVRAFRTEYPIPDRYYTVDPVCEHCNSKRKRKDTYLVYNTVSKEFKQVGRSCLKDFTKGLDAEAVTRYISWFDELIKGQEVTGSGYINYFEVKEVLALAIESVRLYGYRKNDPMAWGESTRDVVSAFLHGSKETNKHLEKGFNPDWEVNKDKAEEILEFVKGMPDEFGYVSNLKTLCSKVCCTARDLGIVVSAVACFNREKAKEEKRAKEQKAASQSSWVGEEGKRITLEDLSVKLLTSWDNQYGVTHMYQLTDPNGNIFIWKTGNQIKDAQVSLKGTVKAHGEFNGVKQTELTRCRIS